MAAAPPVDCPWCGRSIQLGRAGVLPRHKRVTGTHPVTGHPQRAWCDGSSELPYALTAQQRRHLRTQWRDDAGELLGGDDTWS